MKPEYLAETSVVNVTIGYVLEAVARIEKGCHGLEQALVPGTRSDRLHKSMPL